MNIRIGILNRFGTGILIYIMNEQPPNLPRNNVIQGPWGKKPPEKTENNIGDRTPESLLENLVGDDPKIDLVRALIGRMNGLSNSFLEVCSTARASRPLEKSISEQKQILSSWTQEDLISFANNESNHKVFLQKPALAIAIYDLLNKF